MKTLAFLFMIYALVGCAKSDGSPGITIPPAATSPATTNPPPPQPPVVPECQYVASCAVFCGDEYPTGEYAYAKCNEENPNFTQAELDSCAAELNAENNACEHGPANTVTGYTYEPN